MNPTIIFLLKVNIAIALFYLFYRLFFAGDTLWKTRRLYMIFSILLSFTYPFFSIVHWLEQSQPMQQLIVNYQLLQEVTITPEGGGSIDPTGILYLIYGLIAGILLIRFFIQLFSIVRINWQGKSQLVQGTEIIAIKGDIAPFSFFGKIYMNPSLHNELQTKEILAHELTHVRQLHSLDVILSEMLTIICWFNPASWLLKREIRQNLEFLADNKVIESGFDTKSYQYHLLQLTYQTPDLKLTNRFNISPLKKRITMMNQQKTSRAGILKYLLIVPLGLALIVSSNAETLISSAKKTLQDKTTAINVQNESQQTTDNATKKLDEIVVVGYAVAQEKPKAPAPPPVPKQTSDVYSEVQKEIAAPPPPPSSDDVVFMVVEKMPQFPGGDSELFKFLSQNIKYPVEAQKAGIQGRVICQFVVQKDGTISNVEVVRSVDPNLDAEAVRVIKAMPEWQPGEQRGKKVSVEYTLPINFKLDDSPSKGKAASTTPTIIVVDGEIKTAEYMSQIKKEDIKEIEVLKGDTEERKKVLIKKYGGEASKGVILITTKK
jgi:TonB family protein